MTDHSHTNRSHLPAGASPAPPAALGWQMSLLFVALLLVFVYLPIDVELPISLFALMFSGVLLAVSFAVRTQRNLRGLSIVLALLPVSLSWAATLLVLPPTWLELSAFAASAIFVVYTMAIIVVQLVHVQIVSVHTITGALSLYLLLGILGGLLFAIIETAVPGSLAYNAGGSLTHIERTVDLFPPMLYFSFTTLTTLGFGDLYPVSATARAVAILEAVAGQMYLVVMVAVLVSMFAAERSRRDREHVEHGQRDPHPPATTDRQN
jgi:voltage-gated potassium channel